MAADAAAARGSRSGPGIGRGDARAAGPRPARPPTGWATRSTSGRAPTLPTSAPRSWRCSPTRASTRCSSSTSVSAARMPGARLAALEAAVTGSAKPVVACVVGADGELPERDVPPRPQLPLPRGRGARAGHRRRPPRLARPPARAGARARGLRRGRRRTRRGGRAGDGWTRRRRRCALLAPPAGARRSRRRRPGEADAVAVLVGAVNDAELGPVVGVAPGGGLGWRGWVARPATRLPPRAADRRRRRGAGRRPARGPRRAAGAARTTPPALRDVVLRLAALADAVPELAEAELDPVLVGAGGVVVGGGPRLRLAPPPARDRAEDLVTPRGRNRR